MRFQIPGINRTLVLATLLALVLAAVTGDRTSADEVNQYVSGNRQPRIRISNASWQRSTTTIIAEPSHEWRKTKLGWRQIPLRSGSTIHRLNIPERRPIIHPFQIATLILLSVLAALCWASDEWNWGRLVDDDPGNKKSEPA